MALEGLYLPTTKPWAEALRSELLSFPAGKHDDQADALGLMGQMLDSIGYGETPKIVPFVQRDRYTRGDEFREQEEEVNWKVL